MVSDEALPKVVIVGTGDFLVVEFLFKERQSNEYLGGAEQQAGA